MGDVGLTPCRFIVRGSRKFKALLERALIKVYVHGDRATLAEFDRVRQ